MYNIVTLNVQFVNSRTVLKLSFKSFLLEYRTMVISPAFFHILTKRLFTIPNQKSISKIFTLRKPLNKDITRYNF